MASLLRTPSFRALPTPPPPNIPLKSPKPTCISFGQRGTPRTFWPHPLRSCARKPLHFAKLVPFASEGETQIETEADAAETLEKEEAQQPQPADGAENRASEDEVEEMPISPILASLQSYKEAVATENASRVVEIEALLKSIEDDKANLELKVATLTEELSVERERVRRIGAEFENYRQKTETERVSLVTNAQGELVEKLLLILDNFKMAKTQIKAGTEAEEKINNSYQSIYKQYVDILTSLGVAPIEPKGVDSKLSRALDKLKQVVNQVGSGFKKTWTGFYTKD